MITYKKIKTENKYIYITYTIQTLYLKSRRSNVAQSLLANASTEFRRRLLLPKKSTDNVKLAPPKIIVQEANKIQQ